MPAKGFRMQPMAMSRLQVRLQRALESRSVQQVADEWDVPYWVVRDTARGSTDCPRGLYIPGIARGLGITADQLIEDAYAPAEPEAVA